MNTTQIFHQLTDCQFLGRNGVFHQHGLDFQVVGNVVHLSPILRTGAIGRAWVSLPIEDIPAAIGALDAICRKAIGLPSVENTEPAPLTMKVGSNYLLENGLIVKITAKNLAHFHKEYEAIVFGIDKPFLFDTKGKRYEGTPHIVAEIPPTVFEIGKKYRTRNDEVWTVAHFTTTNDGTILRIHAVQESGPPVAFGTDGSFLGANNDPHLYDLVQQV